MTACHFLLLSQTLDVADHVISLFNKLPAEDANAITDTNQKCWQKIFNVI